jgi:hypothetical protein
VSALTPCKQEEQWQYASQQNLLQYDSSWSSNTFLMYIHEQIVAFSLGFSKKTSTEIGWHNIEGPAFMGNPAVAAA